jgi:hypothetical protein
MSNEAQSTAPALRQWVSTFVCSRVHVDDLGYGGKRPTNRDYRHGPPSISAQKKASSLYGATTDAVVLPKQGVTPKRERGEVTTFTTNCLTVQSRIFDYRLGRTAPGESAKPTGRRLRVVRRALGVNRAAVPTEVVRPALRLGPSTLRVIRGIEVLGWDRKRRRYAAWVVALDQASVARNGHAGEPTPLLSR